MGHGDGAQLVLVGIARGFALDLPAGTSRARHARGADPGIGAPTLDDEVGDDPVEGEAVVEAGSMSFTKFATVPGASFGKSSRLMSPLSVWKSTRVMVTSHGQTSRIGSGPAGVSMNFPDALPNLVLCAAMSAQILDLKPKGGGDLKINGIFYRFELTGLMCGPPPKGGLPGAIGLEGNLVPEAGRPFHMVLTVLKNGSLSLMHMERSLPNAYPDNWAATPKTRRPGPSNWRTVPGGASNSVARAQSRASSPNTPGCDLVRHPLGDLPGWLKNRPRCPLLECPHTPEVEAEWSPEPDRRDKRRISSDHGRRWTRLNTTRINLQAPRLRLHGMTRTPRLPWLFPRLAAPPSSIQRAPGHDPVRATVFALPFALLGALSAAQGLPPWRTSLWILAAMVGARTAAMTFNRLVDVDVDAENPRTASRALPAGRVSRAGAMLFMGAGIVLFGLAAGALGPLTWALSPLALIIILGYSLCKRFTAWAHVVLGLSLAGAPLGAWIAVSGRIEAPALWLSGGVLAWTAGFDIIYSLQDEAFDRSWGLHSIPSKLGTPWALLLSRGLHALALLCWGMFNQRVGGHFWSWAGWAASRPCSSGNNGWCARETCLGSTRRSSP